MTARVLMVQGTASNAGKSVLVTALCRILRQDGYRVAPFKSQNMALNAAVTPDGGEIGRAQAAQAEAAGVAPATDMNPILLKPEAEARSQVIIAGQPIGVLSAREYFRRKPEFWPVVTASLDRLRASYDVVVLEGAGSPAEINLKAGDIVNMRVARYAQAPVLLVGDIDRGGMFAHLVGTMELLEPEERALVRGFVINKFRGDPALLGDGLAFLERRCGVPTLGVVPWSRDIRIADEDSVALDTRRGVAGPVLLDIAVLRAPRISNFDDFDALASETGVGVRFVERRTELGQPDLIMLPGSKATVADLQYLREQGLADAVVRLAHAGTPVIGICGGYQMLGRVIRDPDGVESDEREVPGLGLLPVETTFQKQKRTTRVAGRVLEAGGLLAGAVGEPLLGYEIHAGSTFAGGMARPFIITERQGQPAAEPDGALSGDGLILGAYIHGLFDAPGLRRALLHNVAGRKGVTLALDGPGFSREAEYDKLAAHVREALDMTRLYGIIGLGGPQE